MFKMSNRVPRAIHTNETLNFHKDHQAVDFNGYEEELVIEYDEKVCVFVC